MISVCSPPNPKMNTRTPAFDSLRAIAVALVVIHHWTAWGPAIGISFGNIGVQLFFVLSGFLITRILLGIRDRYLAGETSVASQLTSFQLSRIARIWPVAFLTLALVYAAGDRFEQRADMGWHALFASNVLFFLRGDFHSNLAHFWSLAVEQQFYLVWPLVVLLAPRARLEPIILTLVVVAPLSRLGLHAAGFTKFAQFNVLPFASLDSLGSGALVAVWSRMAAAETAERWRVLRRAAAVAVAGLVALRLSAGVGLDLPANLEQTLYAVAFAGLIAAAQSGINGKVGRLLSWAPLVWLGGISYGVYVYHMFAPRIVGAGLRGVEAPQILQAGVPLFIASALLTLAAANVSWLLMERPVLALRKSWQPPTASRIWRAAFAKSKPEPADA
jgi:peptidoglycan/LPS O-acetylase OafA/YrhL